jgi:hypothetical protein
VRTGGAEKVHRGVGASGLRCIRAERFSEVASGAAAQSGAASSAGESGEEQCGNERVGEERSWSGDGERDRRGVGEVRTSGEVSATKSLDNEEVSEL